MQHIVLATSETPITRTVIQVLAICYPIWVMSEKIFFMYWTLLLIRQHLLEQKGGYDYEAY